MPKARLGPRKILHLSILTSLSFSFVKPTTPATSADTNQLGIASTTRSGVHSASVPPQIIFVVNSAHDHPDDSPGDGYCDTGNNLPAGDECTLRAAIEETNATAGTDPVEIRIDVLSPARGGQIFGYDAVHDTWTIPVNTPATGRPMGWLPWIARAGVTIDGTFQKADPTGRFFDASCGNLLEGNPHRLKVKIDGTLQVSGRLLQPHTGATGFVARGLVLANGPDRGVNSYADDALFECLHVGTGFDGTSAEPNWIGIDVSGSNSHVYNNLVSGNDDFGIHMSGLGCVAAGNLIGTDRLGTYPIPNAKGIGAVLGTVGGLAAGDRNVISGNTDYGVYVGDAKLLGNFVGISRTGTAPVGNGLKGVSAGTDALIGGPSAAEGNVISGNAGPGIEVYVSADNAVIQGNRIGTNPAGTSAVPNGTNPPGGPGIDNLGYGTYIGGTEPGAGNLISGNSGDGIRITGGSSLIQGNFIGTDLEGLTALPNGGSGVYDDNNASNASSGTHIGGDSPGSRNVISGNTLRGIRLAGAEARVRGNFVGLDAAGTTAIPNGDEGILEAGGYNVIGGDVPEAGNVISGNTGPGIRILGGGASVFHNAIGTNAAKSQAVPNGDCGIYEDTPGGLSIGAPEKGNVIAGNTKCGIYSEGNETWIRGNRIGFGEGVPIPNGPSPGAGIVLTGNEIRVGGVNPGEGNFVGFNTGHGIRVRSAPGSRTAILGNQVVENGALGIDLEGGAEDGFGVTANDPSDADTGPNDLVNYPVLFPIPNDGSQAVLAFHLDGLASSTFRVEIFVNEGPDPSGYGEGLLLRKAVTVATDVSGHAEWGGLGAPADFPPGSWATATATYMPAPDSYLQTSEFSAAVPVTAPGVDAHVRVWLEGAYDEGSMRTDLAAAGRIPVEQPFARPPFDYPGLEAVPPGDGNSNGIPDYFETHPDIVDWVLLELVEFAEDEYGAIGHVTVARRAAFLRDDGWIIEGDGVSDVQFTNVVHGSFFLLVHHRNHLAVMSAEPASCTSGTCTWDFTLSQEKAWGAPIAMKQLAPGAFGMIAGDADSNGQIEDSDRHSHWAPFVGKAGYYAPDDSSPDFDLNGQIQNSDKNLLWLPNLGRVRQLPPIDGE